MTPARQRQLAVNLPPLRLDPSTLPGDLRQLFDAPVSDIWMEIGFGAGEHLAGQAARHPDIGFIGCEPFVNGVASLLSMVDDQGLSNVRLFDDDVRLLLPALTDASIGRLYILFSDPWPKTRHHRRRITVPENLGHFARLLRPGGELRFATDQPEFAAWSLQRLLREPRLHWLAKSKADWSTAPNDWIETRYETKARSRGLKPIYLNFRRPFEEPLKAA